MANRDEPRPHPEFSKATGDIVIFAKDVDVTVAFRVHSVILAEHSSVFADMLTVPVDNEALEKYEDVPVVQVTDSAEDLAALLTVFYTPAYPQFEAMDKDFEFNIYALMSIATKYQVDTLCNAIVERVRARWPTTLEHLSEDPRRVASHSHWDEYTKTSSPAFPEPAAAIRFGVDFNVPEILPMAYYVLTTYPYRKGSHARPFRWSDGVENPRWHLLHDDERFRACRGKLELAQEMVWVLQAVQMELQDRDCTTVVQGFNYRDGDLADSSTCRAITTGFKRERGMNMENPVYETETHARLDPLGTAIVLSRQIAKWGLCAKCLARARKNLQREIRDIWAGLPDTFSL